MTSRIKITPLFANILLLITAFLWGSGFICTELALDGNLTPIQVICGRMLVASAVLNTFFYKKLISINKYDIKAGLIVGSFFFLGSIFQNSGLQYVTSSVSAFVTAIYVIMIPFIKYIFFKDKPDVYSNIGAVLTVCGVGMISLSAFKMSAGVPVTLVCALFFALQVIFTDIYAKKVDPVKLTIIMINLNFLLGLAGTGFDGFFNGVWPELSLASAGNMLYLGFICTCVACTFQNVAQKYTLAVQAAIIMSLESVFGSLLSVVILGEQLTLRMFIGCAMIFTAIIVSETKLRFFKKSERVRP